MLSKKIFSYLSVAVVCSLFVITGCAGTGEKTATLALKFAEQDSTTYKLTTQAEKSVEFEGLETEEDQFKGGRSGNEIEMVFTQQIQSVDDKGNAVAKITIKELKYIKKIKDNIVLNFDSSRQKDASSPMAKLIGQSYTIKIAPDGKVAKIVNAKQIRAKFKSRAPASKAALGLLSNNAIQDRHGTVTLPAKDKNKLQKGDSWSSIKSFAFGLMGPKSYEKIYAIKDIKKIKKHRLAVIEMNTIPTTKTDGQLDNKTASSISNAFDNTETYTGRLELDLTTGKVEKYLEKLNMEWVIAEPLDEQESDKEPAVLRMGISRLYKIEKID